MPSTTASVGEIASIANSVQSIADNIRAGTSSGGDIVAGASAAVAIAQALTQNPIVAELGGIAAVSYCNVNSDERGSTGTTWANKKAPRR